jgi:hypothetical protein
LVRSILIGGKIIKEIPDSVGSGTLCIILKTVLYMNMGTTRLRGRPRNRWQNEVREDGRTVGGEG